MHSLLDKSNFCSFNNIFVLSKESVFVWLETEFVDCTYSLIQIVLT